MLYKKEQEYKDRVRRKVDLRQNDERTTPALNKGPPADPVWKEILEGGELVLET